MHQQVLTVSPVPSSCEPHGPSAFEGRLQGLGELLIVSRKPFIDAARELLKRGFDTRTMLVMVHATAPGIVALQGTIGKAAGLRVLGCRFVPATRSERRSFRTRQKVLGRPS
jgi:hypothetical protein